MITKEEYEKAQQLVNDYMVQERDRIIQDRRDKKQEYYNKAVEEIKSGKYDGVITIHTDTHGDYIGEVTHYAEKIKLYEVNEENLSNDHKKAINDLIVYHFPF